MRPASEPGSARARPGRVSRARRSSTWIDGSCAAYERMGMPPAFQWARLKANIKCALRKGAWYRILKLTSADAVLDVKGDRKSTRLNSSHGYISYAVFCLKKKNATSTAHPRGQLVGRHAEKSSRA